MKFAFCLFAYFPYGGLQRDCMRMLRESQARGHVVDLYTGAWEGPREEDVNVIHVQARAWTNHGVNRRFHQRLEPLLRAGRYDAVVGFNKIPGLDVYYAGDVCYAARNAHLPFYRRAMPRYRNLVELEAAVFSPDSSTEILLLAATQQADYMRCYGTPAHRFHIMPPDMPVDRLFDGDLAAARIDARRFLNVPAEERMILMVGSGFRAKGVDRAIRALAALPEELKSTAKLVIVGADNPRSYMALAATLGVQERVQFMGGRENVPHFFLAADLLLHPAYHEMTGTVLLEAMGHGLPVLTTETCGFAIHVEQANGGLVLPSPFVQDQLNDALVTMLTSARQSEWRSNGHAYMSRLPLGRRAIAAVDVVEQIAARRSTRNVG